MSFVITKGLSQTIRLVTLQSADKQKNLAKIISLKMCGCFELRKSLLRVCLTHTGLLAFIVFLGLLFKPCGTFSYFGY